MKKYIIIISFLSCVFATSFTMETKNAVIGNFTKSKEQNDYRYAKHILLLKKELKKLDNPLDVYKPDEKKFITHSIKKRTIDLWQKNFQDLKNIFEDELYCQDEEANTFWKELKKNPLAMNIDLDFSSINEIFLNAYQAFLVNQEQIKTQKLIANLLRLHKLFQIIKFMPFWVAELDRMSLQKNSIDELFLVRDYFVKEFPSSKKILAAILQKNFKDVLNIIEKECNVIINNEFFIDEQAQDKIIFSQVETSDKNFVKESSENEKLWKMYAERSMTLHQLNYKNSVHIGVQYQKLGLFCDKKFLNQVIHEFYETIRSFSKEKNLNIANAEIRSLKREDFDNITKMFFFNLENNYQIASCHVEKHLMLILNFLKSNCIDSKEEIEKNALLKNEIFIHLIGFFENLMAVSIASQAFFKISQKLEEFPNQEEQYKKIFEEQYKKIFEIFNLDDLSDDDDLTEEDFSKKIDEVRECVLKSIGVDINNDPNHDSCNNELNTLASMYKTFKHALPSTVSPAKIIKQLSPEIVSSLYGLPENDLKSKILKNNEIKNAILALVDSKEEKK